MWSVNATWESVTIPVLISNVLYLVKTCEYHLCAQKWWNSLSQQSLPTFPIFFFITLLLLISKIWKSKYPYFYVFQNSGKKMCPLKTGQLDAFLQSNFTMDKISKSGPDVEEKYIISFLKLKRPLALQSQDLRKAFPNSQWWWKWNTMAGPTCQHYRWLWASAACKHCICTIKK